MAGQTLAWPCSLRRPHSPQGCSLAPPRKCVPDRKILAHTGATNRLVQVIHEARGELVYNLRIQGQSFQPHVFAKGKYTVKILDPDSDRTAELAGIVARPNNDALLTVEL